MDIMTYAAAVAYTNKKTAGGGSGGTTDYNALTNKPSLNGIELVGNQTLEDFGISEYVDIGDFQDVMQPINVSQYVEKIKSDSCVGISFTFGGRKIIAQNKINIGLGYMFTSVMPSYATESGATDGAYFIVGINIQDGTAELMYSNTPYIPTPTSENQILVSGANRKYEIQDQFLEFEISDAENQMIDISNEQKELLYSKNIGIKLKITGSEMVFILIPVMKMTTIKYMFYTSTSYLPSGIGTIFNAYAVLVNEQNKIQVVLKQTFSFLVNNSNASAQNKKIVDVATPTNPTDAATKQYVDDGLAANRALPRQFDLFGLRPNGTATVNLPIARDNVLVIFYSIAPDGTVNVANSKAVRVDKGASATKDALTIAFNADGLSFTLTSTEATNSILGQYYSYNNI